MKLVSLKSRLEMVEAARALEPSDFLFSVEAAGTAWDVYNCRGKAWGLALRIVDGVAHAHKLLPEHMTEAGAVHSIETAWGDLDPDH